MNELVVAYPWRSSGRAEALAYGLAAVLDIVGDGPARVAEVVAEQGQVLADAPGGHRPRVTRPTVPVVAITGTNGKTTTSRMIGHIARQAGVSVGWSSTDGVFFNGELVEPGDYSGPSGAARVLSQPGVELAVTETARGGILRRGVGVSVNDVSVVTNISADHLGMGGIDTLDQLAEVKAVITTITRPDGWCVLNADDPRTFAMRLGTKAQIWVFTLDIDSPAGRRVLDQHGRVTTVLDGWVVVLGIGPDPLPVVAIVDVPMTLAGLSRVNVENVLAAASAAMALGFSAEQVADGLATFFPAENNPGRMNIWTVPTLGRGGGAVDGAGVTVVVDLAHNEAGLAALIEIMNGLRPPGNRLLLGVGTAGDRSDEVFVRLGELAALGADVVEIAHKTEYLRGRTPAEITALIREGAAHAGTDIATDHSSELACLESLVDQADDGDVVAVMAHQDRQRLDEWLTSRGGTRDDPEAIQAKVRRASAGSAAPPAAEG